MLAKRNNLVASLIMLDVDNFKTVNDTHGHKVGDLVLMHLASILKNISRKSDIVSRFGGEEFIVLLPYTDLEGASFMAEKIRASIETSSVQIHTTQELQFTASFGVSQIKFKDENPLEAAIKRADDALYDAKNNGKNRISTR